MPSEPVSQLLKTIFIGGGCLLLWRLWRFTLKPLLNPHEPKEFPYWTPSYAIPFFRNAEATLRDARHYFGNTREPFTLTLAGQRVYVLTAPKDHSAVYKNLTDLTFDGIIRNIYTDFGVSKEGIDKMWQTPAFQSTGKPKRIHLGQTLHKEQLHPGRHLEDVTSIYIKEIQQQFHGDRVRDISRHNSPAQVVALYEWCADILGSIAIQALFGNALLDLEPDLLDYLYTFDSDSWKLIFRLPRVFAKRMHDAKNKAGNAFVRYFQLPTEKRPGLCYFLRSIEEKQRRVGITDEDIGIIAQIFSWAAIANIQKVSFWLLCYLIRNPSLLEDIRNEITPYITGSTIDLDGLLNCCPILEASFNETLRLTSVSTSLRSIEGPVLIGGKYLSVDSKILMPYRQLHFDETIFGPEPRSFNHQRFLKNEGLSRHAAFKPFGGGSTVCSGRFLAKREILAFVALVIQRYEIAFENPRQPFPRMDETKPTLGIMDPLVTDHIRCTLLPRD